jgi:hypothetical protein
VHQIRLAAALVLSATKALVTMSIVSPRARPHPDLRIRRRRIVNRSRQGVRRTPLAHSLPQLFRLHRVSLSQRACFFHIGRNNIVFKDPTAMSER